MIWFVKSVTTFNPTIMSNPILEAELAEAMHEFVYDYCKDVIGEPDQVYYHDLINNKNNYRDGHKEDWACFLEDFQEYLNNQ